MDTPTTATTVGISSDESASGWDRLLSVIEECQMETGITDLADQHDHYLYGTPKHDDQGT